MTTLVIGASGATGKLLVDQLLRSGQKVKIIVRSTRNLPAHWNSTGQLTVINRSITEIVVEEMVGIIADCQSVASCLGHNLTWKGIYGKPRKLVLDAVTLLCEAILKNDSEKAVKFVLMNTAGYSNRDIGEQISPGEKIVVGLLRLLIPPYPDQEKAADYLRVKVGQNNPYIEWVVIRPDNLINEESVTGYSIHKSPIRSTVFNPGKTSRINVAHFMARLVSDDNLWTTWRGQMPVIYNDSDPTK